MMGVTGCYVKKYQRQTPSDTRHNTNSMQQIMILQFVDPIINIVVPNDPHRVFPLQTTLLHILFDFVM